MMRTGRIWSPNTIPTSILIRAGSAPRAPVGAISFFPLDVMLTDFGHPLIIFAKHTMNRVLREPLGFWFFVKTTVPTLLSLFKVPAKLFVTRSPIVLKGAKLRQILQVGVKALPVIRVQSSATQPSPDCSEHRIAHLRYFKNQVV